MSGSEAGDDGRAEIDVVRPTRDEFLTRVVRYADLPTEPNTYPDSQVAGYQKVFRSVVGSLTKTEDGKLDPIPLAGAIQVNEGYKFSYLEAEPGNGSTLHWHDTAETFIVMDGVWRFNYAGADGQDSVDAGPWDVIAVAPRVFRGFECIEPAPGKRTGTIGTLIIGEAPMSVMSQESIDFFASAGVTFPSSGVHATPGHPSR